MQSPAANPWDIVPGSGVSRPDTGVILWTLVVLLFGVGDVVTTLYGLGLAGVSEQLPVAQLVLSYGVWAVVGYKAVVVALFYQSYRGVKRPYTLGIPIGLTLVGTYAVVNNVYVIWVAV